MKIKVKDLKQSAVFAAIVFAATMTGALAPIGDGAYLHIGDAFVYVTALLLPTPFAVASSVLGTCLADIVLDSAIYLPATLLSKAAVVLVAKELLKLAKTELMQDTLVSLCGTVNVAVYFAYECIIFSFKTGVSGILFNVLQALASAVVLIIISGAARKIYKRVTKSDD